MALSPLSVSLLLLHAIRLTPESVPARGNQETLVTLDKASRVVITARSPAGTECEMVDHVRGPFARSGTAGRTNCELDLLLDAGTYKLRLASNPPSKKKTQRQDKVTLQAEPYTEDNAQPVLLEEGREVRQTLATRHQASFWLKLDKRQPVILRVSGRTAGDVRLWRNNEWLEPVSLRDGSVHLRAGQPIYEWWLETTLDPGSYMLTTYGASPKEWTEGKADDTLSVAYGFPKAPVERTLSMTLPPWGLSAVELPAGGNAVFLSRESASQSTSRLSIHPLAADGGGSLTSTESGCQIQSKALIPQCSTVVAGEGRHVALVRGEPGTRFTLQWSNYVTGKAYYTDGSYGAGGNVLRFEPAATGEYLVGLNEVPLDVDSAPLGCMLAEENPKNRDEWAPIAFDAVEVDRDRPFRRSFNYDGSSATIWVKVQRSGRYVFSTGGERKTRCELYRVEGAKYKRLTKTDSEEETCRVPISAEPGLYELKVYGGTEGIERLTVALDGQEPAEDSATHTSCLFPRQKLEKGFTYRFITNRIGRSSLRGLTLRPLPLTLTEPMPLVLDGPMKLELPLPPGVAAEVRATGEEPFTCTLGGTRLEPREGRCTLPSTGGTLTLSQQGKAPLAMMLHRPVPPPAPPPLTVYTPNIMPLPVLQPGTTAWFDFDRGQAHSLTFDVKEAGLYHVTTQGLLSTGCVIRTPVVQEVGSATGGGRGRNCLVSSYLRPGRYLLTARTEGQSRGRGGVLLERRGVKAADGVRSDSEVFFRVDAGELIQQRLVVSRTADYTLSTAAQGAQLQCRLDDPQGWPVVTVPTPCEQGLRLTKGNYLWTQLPLTVESMRRTALERVVPPVVLKGNKAHPVRFNAWHLAELGKDGKDEFSFEVPARMEVFFTLTHGMQGRLYVTGADGVLKPVEVIAPQSSYAPPPPPPQYTEPSEYEGEESSEESSYTEEAPSEEYTEEGVASAEPMPTTSSPAPTGESLTLEPGRYKLVAEHSRGDVAISYGLYLRTEVLAPGMEKDVGVPGNYAVRLPVDGTLRLFTRGSTDVRCRLFNALGQLEVESTDHGADWNCAIAEPIDAGDYTLVLESQTQRPGPSRVSVALAQVSDAGVLAEGGTLDVGSGVVRASLPPAPPEALQEVTLRAKAPFSCALEDSRGAVVSRRMDVRECVMMLRPGPSTWRVRVWTLGQPTKVSTGVAARLLRPHGGKLAAGEAASAQITRPGRYETARGILCLPASQQGPLRPCGPEASLEAGDWVFGMPGAKGETALSLNERVDTLEATQEERVALARDVTLLRQRSKQAALHLLRVGVPFGDPAYPACRLDGGVAVQRNSVCFAATGPTQESLARWWTPAGDKGEGTLQRLSIPSPATSMPLQPGLQDVTWSGGPTLRLTLPGEPMQVRLALPRDAWAVRVNEQGAAVDLCAPSETHSRCVLGGAGGAVLLWSPAESRLQAEMVAMEAGKQATFVSQLFEAVIRTPGQQRLAFGAADGERHLRVTGGERCVATLEDGTRLEGCDTRVPPGRSGVLLVETAPGGLRAVLAPAQGVTAAMLAPGTTAQAPELPAARALRLTGAQVERTLNVPTDTVVHLRGDSGVCGLAQGGTVLVVDGLERGCAFDRLLKAGSYRLVVRGFAGEPLSGTVTWTHEPVKELTEGVAQEEGWLSPGQTRYFRFNTASAGNIGLGLQVPSEVLACSVLDASQRVLGEGCQQYLRLEAGSYLLAIHAPATLERPLPFKPVLVGLAGAKTDVPEEYLRDFFQRIGANP